TVSVNVTSLNERPRGLNNTAPDSKANVTSTNNVLLNDTPNVDSGETLTVIAVTTPGHGTAVISSNQVNYTPDANFNGTDSCVYRSEERRVGKEVTSVSITVTTNKNQTTGMTRSA